MLEHYSHIRLDAKRQALDALAQSRRGAEKNGDGSGSKETNADRETNSGDPKHPTTTRKFRCSWHSRKALRHGHVTVWFCADRRLPVNC